MDRTAYTDNLLLEEGSHRARQVTRVKVVHPPLARPWFWVALLLSVLLGFL